MRTEITRNSVILSIFQRLRATNKTGIAVVLCAASCYFHYIVTAVVLFAGLVFLLCNKQLFRDTFLHKWMIPFLPLAAMLVVVPYHYRNFKGAIAGVGIILMVLLFLLCCKRMTISLFDLAMDVCCLASYAAFLYAFSEKLILGWWMRSYAGMYNPNYYGTVLEFTVLICLYRIIRNHHRRLFYYITLLACSLALFWCDSQSAWVTIAVSVFALLVLCKKKRAILLALSACAVLVIIALSIPSIMYRIMELPYRYDLRSYIWSGTCRAIQSYPLFGFGTMAYSVLWQPLSMYPATHAHNLYLDVFLCYGIVGVAFWMFYVVRYIKKLIQNIRTRYCYACALSAAALVAVLVHGLTDHTVLWIQTGFLFGLLLCGTFVKRVYRGEK